MTLAGVDRLVLLGGSSVGVTALDWRHAATPVGALLVEGAGLLAVALAVAVGVVLGSSRDPYAIAVPARWS